MTSITTRRVNQVVSSSGGMRIALVTGVLKAGGGTTFLCNFAGELQRRNIPVIVLSFESDNPHDLDFLRLGVKVHAYDHQSLIFEDRLTAIYDELAKFRPTVVVANLGAMAFEVLRYMPEGVFRMGVAHGDQDGFYELLGRYASHLDVAAAISKTIEAKLNLLPEFRRQSVQYLPLGVPIPERELLSRGEHDKPLHILFLGRLERVHKRVHLLPDMLRQLIGSGIPFHWTMVGDGAEKEALMSEMRCESEGQTVSFTGQVTYDEIPKLLASHDVFLLVSDTEGLPLSLLEAMGQGLVPVVSELPSGIAELVDHDTGFLIPPHELAGYMNAIIHLHHHRRELDEKSRRSREKVEKEFSIAAMTDRWLRAMPTMNSARIDWQKKIKTKPILGVTNRWRFSAPARWVRRILICIRKKI